MTESDNDEFCEDFSSQLKEVKGRHDDGEDGYENEKKVPEPNPRVKRKAPARKKVTFITVSIMSFSN